MSEVEVAEPSLGIAQLDNLLSQARSRPELARQLAIDASKLIAGTGLRVEELKKKGFFRRCWSALSGNTSAMERATTADIVEMQGLAWQYLSALQEQGLICVRALTVIRGNLIQLARTQSETNANVVRVVGKLTELKQQSAVDRAQVVTMLNRIHERLDAQAAEIDEAHGKADIALWLARIKASRASALPPVMSALRLGIEYASIVKGDDSTKERLFNPLDLGVAFAGLNLDDKQQFTTRSFAAALAGAYNSLGQDEFFDLLGLSSVSPADANELADSVPSIGFGWTFAGATALPMIYRVARHADDSSRSQLVELALAEELTDIGDAELSLLEIAVEVAAGFSLAQSIEREQVDPGVIAEPVAISEVTVQPGATAFSLEDLLSRHVDIRFHVMGASDVTQDGRELYVQSLALLFHGGPLTPAQKGYLGSISHFLGLSFDEGSFDDFDPKAFASEVKRFKLACNDRAKRNSWLVDAIVLASMDASRQANVRIHIEHMARALGIEVSRVDSWWSDVQCLASSSALLDLLRAAGRIEQHTGAWRSLLQYRQISFRNFSEVSAFPALGNLLERRKSIEAEVREAPRSDAHFFLNTVKGLAPQALAAAIAGAGAEEVSETYLDGTKMRIDLLAEDSGKFLNEAHEWISRYGDSLALLGIKVPNADDGRALIDSVLNKTPLPPVSRLRLKIEIPLIDLPWGIDQTKFAAVLYSVGTAKDVAEWHETIGSSLDTSLG